MPDASPEYIEAINQVIENKDPRAEWDDDEMRSALLEVASGETLSDAAESRGFSKGTLSDVRQQVDDLAQELAERRESSEGFFEDPVEDAVEGVQDFFDQMEQNYGVEVNDIAIQLMTDEIRDAEQLPSAHDFSRFLQSVNAGVGDDKIWLLTRRYDSWLQKFEKQRSGGGFDDMGFGMGGGTDVSGGNRPAAGFGGGRPAGNAQSVLPNRGGQESQESNSRVDRLESEIEELKSLIREDNSGDSDQGQITIERENGPNVTMPANHPAVAEMMGGGGGGGDDDFLSTLQKAAEAGLVATPEDIQQAQGGQDDFDQMLERLQALGVIDTGEGNEMAEAIQQAIADLGQKQIQAQQQMSQNFTQVMEDLKELQEDDDGELTLEDVEAVIDEKLTKSETERLRDEMDQKFEQVMDEVQSSRRRNRGGKQDTEYLKTDRKMEFQEKQIETLNENIQKLPNRLAAAVNEVHPVIKDMQSGGQGGGNPLFTPPDQQQPRGQPDYHPGQGDQPAREERDQRNTNRRDDPRRDEGYPEGRQDERREREPADQSAEQESSGTVSEERAREIRERLPVGDTTGGEGAGA